MKARWFFIALGVCLALALLSPLASAAPDGLEATIGTEGVANQSPLAFIAGYVFPGVANQTLATILAGWCGVLLVFAATYSLFWLIERLRKRHDSWP